ncbi:MAG: CHASE2 domain-containing protein, partial [Okeania sp. SIO2H7]|nr:CHASE2 domain-containing protein [Okeania sp. SIO2H7]
MFKLHNRLRSKTLKKIQQWRWEKQRVILTSVATTLGVVIIRSLGLLQSFEWAILDEFVRWRPREPVDERILIVGVSESDFQKYGYPISDKLLAELLTNLQSFQPRAIGLDIYRDLPTEPGHAELVEAFETIPNLVGIELIENAKLVGVKPPEVLKEKNQVGFNNVRVDDDGKVRRGLLYLTAAGGTSESFSLKLALIYLAEEGIRPKAAPNSRYLQLGKAVFQRFKGNDGGYVREEDDGYQILANLRGPNGSFRTVSMEDILSNKVPPELIRDRLILIGHTASSIKDVHQTSYNGGLFNNPQQTSGVELQANFLSQILSAALEGRNSIKVWSETGEWLWIFIWSLVGANLAWKLRSPEGSVLSMLAIAFSIKGFCYLAFVVGGWWLPVVPPVLSLFGSGSAILFYRARLQEEFKRSTEFLQSVIDAIPDPVFVKDINHRRIVLNQAYCRFIGYPLEELLSKTDYDLFSQEQADIFWKHDELVFQQNQQQETEEIFTDPSGVTHVIASKRSLHKDGAGNIFLVGVIRDITERKKMEKQLKQLASELELDNNKLRVLKETLQQQADRD